MTNENLEKILQSKKEKKQAEGSIDWQARRDEWIQCVNNFYGQIKSWLNSYIKKDLIKIKTIKIEITEQYIGAYVIDQMIIEMPDEKVFFTPIGALIIGAHGRIDMQGNRSVARFLLVEKKSDQPHIEVKIYSSEDERKKDEEKTRQQVKTPVEYVWKFATPPPRIKYIELNEDLFSDLFSQVING